MGRSKEVIASKQIISKAREVLLLESQEIKDLIPRIDASFTKAVNIIYKCRGRVVVSGMGKAGIIAQKFSATLSSTGTPSLWVHPAEAAHGDLGRITSQDVVVILSYSGHTEEIKRLLPILKRIGTKIISLTGNKNSPLAKYSHVVLDVSVKKEACPLGLAPTTSTTVMLALCDALSVCIQQLRGFKEEDFALFHPAGSLGKRLLLKVEDIMRKGKEIPLVKENTSVREVLSKITSSKAGAAVVVNKNNQLVGIFTDGDLRRKLLRYPSILDMEVKKVMTPTPKYIEKDMLASSAACILEEYKIDELPVVDKKKKVVGILDIQDLLEAGII